MQRIMYRNMLHLQELIFSRFWGNFRHFSTLLFMINAMYGHYVNAVKRYNRHLNWRSA